VGIKWPVLRNSHEVVFQGLHTFRSSEMNDVSIFLEHVDLFDRLDGLNVKFLERGLQLLVVGAGRLVDFLGLATRCAFASIV
jgi:hypothetical protein